MLTRLALLVVALFLGACSPTFNWREVRVDGSGALALFPCKPDVSVRRVSLAEQNVRMTLAACRAGDSTFALAFADMPAASQVGPALTALKEAAAKNLGSAAAANLREWRVEGMTPNPQALRVSLQGKGAQGQDLVEELGFFCRGTRVFQVTVLGRTVEREAVDTFFSELKLPA